VALKILADHARTMTFLVGDGVVPSNEDRGYVLRRIIRRAVRYAYLLGQERDVTPRLVAAVVEAMGEAYPHLRTDQDAITGTIEREEDRFRATLKRGSTLLETKLSGLSAGDSLPGDVAFDLYETYGFPLEVTQEITAELDIGVDVEGYRAALSRAQQISKAGAKDGGDAYANLASFQDVLDRHGPTEFTGRAEDQSKATVLAVVPGEDGEVSVFLDRTPFYAESGGQVGDTGAITTDTGRVEVTDTTYALPGLHRHHGRVVEGSVEAGQEALAAIDSARRAAIRRNHTGTHVLHWALRQVLGEQVKQQGSLVEPDRLRFDFGPADPLTDDQIREIEDLANAEILSNAPVRHYETTKDHAAEIGAIAFFGDKYGDVVRVLEAGSRSVELCGGTHVSALGDIGPVKIVSERPSGRTCDGSRRSPAPARSSACAPRRRSWPSWPRCSTCPWASSSTAPASGWRRSRRFASRSRSSSARPPPARRPTWCRRPSTAWWWPGWTAPRATPCGRWPCRCGSVPASAPWCWGARPTAAAPPSSPRSRPTAASTPPPSSSPARR
jgi:alanyl-tRNA synthetase